MATRVVIGNGSGNAKLFTLALSQTDFMRKGPRAAGSKQRMFSFSFRCRLGFIRGRSKGEDGTVITKHLRCLSDVLTSSGKAPV